MRSTLVVGSHERDGVVVVRPVGVLDATTSTRLCDALLAHAADHPDALVVDLDELVVARSGTLSVFAEVERRIGTWPAVPLLLAGGHGPLAAARAFRSVADALAAVAATPPRHRAQLPLVAQARQAGSARIWTRQVLLGWQLPLWGEPGRDFVDDAVLVASELVENSVRHAGSPRSLRVDRHDRGLSIAVSDDDPRPPVLVPPAEATRLGGRGLAMVAALASAWGHLPRPGAGKVVWAVLALPG